MWELTHWSRWLVSVCGALAVRAYGSTVWRGAGVRTVLYGDYL